MKEQHIGLMTMSEEALAEMSLQDPNNPSHILAKYFVFSGQPNLEAIALALKTLQALHANLRASYPQQSKQTQSVIKVIHDANQFDPKVTQHSSKTLKQALALADRLIATPFDITRAPLYEVFCVRTEVNQCVLGLRAHHLIVDGLSAAYLFGFIALLHNGFVLCQKIPMIGNTVLQPLLATVFYWGMQLTRPLWQKTSYTTVAERQWLRATQLQAKTKPLPEVALFSSINMRDYLYQWRQHSTQVQGSAFYIKSYELPAGLHQNIDAWAKQLSTSPGRVLLACFLIIMAQTSNHKQLAVRIPNSNRESKVDLRIGYLARDYVFPFDLTTVQTLPELITLISKTVRQFRNPAHLPHCYLLAQIDQDQPNTEFNYMETDYTLSLRECRLVPQAAANRLQVNNTANWRGAQYQIDLSVFFNRTTRSTDCQIFVYGGKLDANSCDDFYQTMQTVIEVFMENPAQPLHAKETRYKPATQTTVPEPLDTADTGCRTSAFSYTL